MLRRIPFIILAAIGLLPLTCCNSSSETESVVAEVYSNVIVKSFKLAPDDSVLVNLDSVFFAVDLDNARIFNPDSLPKGTRLNKITIEPTYGDVSKAEVIMKLYDGSDSTYTYNSANSDTINFENGPVKLKLTSLDGQTTLTYDIQINVHKVDPDLYGWDRFGALKLDANAANIQSSKMISRGDSLMVVVNYGDNTPAALFTGSGNGLEKWSKADVILPDNADLNSLCATDGAFYIMARRKLYSSADLASGVWTDCNTTVDYLYGAQGSQVLAAVNEGDNYYHITYPATVKETVARECPVSGTSQMLTFASKWSAKPMSIIVGGRCADGSLTGDTWAFDGRSWQNISIQAAPARSGMAVSPYFAFSVNNQWIVSDESILMAIGGTDADGNGSTATYISYDRGIHWSKASDNMRIPASVGPVKTACAYTIDALLTDGGAQPSESVWSGVALASLPAWLRPVEVAGSRAVKPVTQWECPYIYIFDQSTASLWRTAVNRLTFKPLQ